MSRLFTFGCSFTKQQYPTWADLLGNDSQFSNYENWGKTGMGNRGIFNRLNEAIVKCKISKEDTVVIMWSTIFREDRFLGNQWKSVGGIYNNGFYKAEWVAEYFNPMMGWMETVNYVNASQRILDNLGSNYTMCFMQIPRLEDINLADSCGRKVNNTHMSRSLYDHMMSISKLSKQDCLEYVINLKEKEIVPPLYDCGILDNGHPTSIAHYHYLKDVILPILKLDNFDNDKKIYKMAIDWSQFMSKKEQDRKDTPLWHKKPIFNTAMFP